MYGKLFNRLKRGCQSVKKSTRSVGSTSRSNSLEAKTDFQPVDKEHSTKDEEDTTKSYQTFGLDLLDTDSSLEDFKKHEKVQPSTSLETTASCPEFEKSASSGSACDIDQFWIGFINSHPYKNWLKVGLALRKNTNEAELLRGWMRDVLKLHRHPPTAGEVFRISNVIKWPTCDGAWEIARVFMSKGYRTGGEGGDASYFDVSALLNFMYRCRVFDQYVYDFNTVKKVLQVRNATMHNPTLQVEDDDMEDSFQTILALLQDRYLSNHAEKYLSTDNFYKNLNKIKSATFDMVTSAKHSLDILKDEIFQSNSSVNHPSAKTLELLRDVLSKILSLPQVHASADLTKIQSKITEMETKVVKDYEEADKKIKKISAHVEHMNKKLDHLRYFMSSQSKTDDEEEAVEDIAPAVKKRKRKRHSSREKMNDQPKKPYPTGILLNNHSIPIHIRDYWNKEKHVSFDRLSSSSIGSSSEGTSVSSFNSLRGSNTESDNVDLYSHHTSPSMQTTKKSFPHRKRIIVDSSEEDDCYNTLSSPPAKRCRISDSEDLDSQPENTSNPNLIIIPNSNQHVTGIYEGEGGDTYLVSKLQDFLRKQPNNDGAVFTIRVDSDQKYFCSVSFQSLYAVSSPNLSYSINEAKKQAAEEARRRVLNSPKIIEFEDAKSWFDDYSKRRTGKVPKYTCFQTKADLYFTHVHMINSNLLRSGTAESHQVFLEASCSAKNPAVDTKSAAIQSALEGTPLPLSSYNVEDYPRVLNEFCLANDATLPIYQNASMRHSKTRKILHTCSLKSFIKKHLSQKLNGQSTCVTNKSSTSNMYNFSPLIEDFVEAQSSEAHRSQVMAEESAARNLLSKLGLSEKRLNETKGVHKIELKNVVKDLDLSIAYHTTKIQSIEDPEDALYNCVVTSTCLKDTQCNFTATSDNSGCERQDEACESAARNALILLGMEIVLGTN